MKVNVYRLAENAALWCIPAEFEPEGSSQFLINTIEAEETAIDPVRTPERDMIAIGDVFYCNFVDKKMIRVS